MDLIRPKNAIQEIISMFLRLQDLISLSILKYANTFVGDPFQWNEFGFETGELAHVCTANRVDVEIYKPENKK